MKENFDPHQVVISRDYFDKLIEMAKPNDYPAGRKDHPNQTIIGRILRHARKYNHPLHVERIEEIWKEIAVKRNNRKRRAEIIKAYSGKFVYVSEGDQFWPACVCGESRRSKVHVRVAIVAVGKCGFFYPHIDDIHLEKPNQE